MPDANLVTSRVHAPSLRFLAALLLTTTLLISGCTQPETEVDPMVFAGDGTIDTLNRYLRPSHYWYGKVAQMSERVNADREAFKAKNAVYLTLLRERREQVRVAVEKARNEGGDARKARKEVITFYRDQLEKLRAASRKESKALRKSKVWLNQAMRSLEEVL
ncbi:MAG: hypothetical protein HQL52_08865 [Magnetococcales bacterium]|nr:hypothetical protein [Magnetococcales bacterium]